MSVRAVPEKTFSQVPVEARLHLRLSTSSFQSLTIDMLSPAFFPDDDACPAF